MVLTTRYSKVAHWLLTLWVRTNIFSICQNTGGQSICSDRVKTENYSIDFHKARNKQSDQLDHYRWTIMTPAYIVQGGKWGCRLDVGRGDAWLQAEPWFLFMRFVWILISVNIRILNLDYHSFISKWVTDYFIFLHQCCLNLGCKITSLCSLPNTVAYYVS